MRFTVKAKLASTFGVVILLSMIAGGVAYLKLNDTVATTEHLSARAARLAKVGDMQASVLLQVRAEKNAILAPTDAEQDKFASQIVEQREHVQKIKDEAYVGASEAGKKMLDVFSAAYANANTVQDQTLKLTKQDKARATDHSMRVRLPSVIGCRCMVP